MELHDIGAAVNLTLRRADNGFFHVVSAGPGDDPPHIPHPAGELSEQTCKLDPLRV